MAASMVLYWISFFPLLRLTGLSSIDQTNPLEIAANEREADLMRYLHNLLFSASTPLYLFVMQSMVKLIKTFRPYPKIYDVIGAITTTTLWTIFCFGALVVVPVFLGKPPIIIAGVVWSLWVMIVDIFVTLVFLTQMLGPKLKLEQSGQQQVNEAEKRNRFIMFLSLGIIFLLTIALIAFPLLSGTTYVNDESNRRFFYRLGFTLSPIWHFGHLLFLKTVQMVFMPRNIKKKQITALPIAQAAPKEAYLKYTLNDH